MERNIEIATETICVCVSSDFYAVARLRGTFANCTYVIVSLLKAWNATVVWIVCDGAFLMPLQECTHHIWFTVATTLAPGSEVFSLEHRYRE